MSTPALFAFLLLFNDVGSGGHTFPIAIYQTQAECEAAKAPITGYSLKRLFCVPVPQDMPQVHHGRS